MDEMSRTLVAFLVGLAVLAGAIRTAASADTFSARELLSLREIGGHRGNISVSPDGSLVAFQLQHADLASRTYRVAWYVVPADGGASVFVGEGGELLLNPSLYGRINGSRADVRAQWSPNGKWIAYIRQDAGEVQIWRSRVDGSQQKQVTHHSADVVAFRWKPDGKGIFFKVDRAREQMRRAERQEGDRGFLFDDRFMPTESAEPLWYPCEQRGGVPTPASQECTAKIWVVSLRGGERELRDEQEVRAFQSSGEQVRPLGVDKERNIRNVVWNASGTSAAWLENERPDRYPGFAAQLTMFTDKARCELAECHGQLKSAWWNGEEVIFLREEGHAYGIPALYAWGPQGRSVRLLHRFDGVLSSCETGHGQLICLHETPTSPRKIVSIRLTDGRLTTVFDPNPRFGRFDLGTVERIEWHDAYGNATFGHLVYPARYREGSRYPLIIVQYRSRGFLRGGVGDEYPIYPLAAAGFVVLSFDRPDDWKAAARGDTSTLPGLVASEAAEWRDGYERHRALSALELILDRLVEQGIVDPARIGITGLSDGAETVEFALFRSRRFAAAAHSGGNPTPSYYYLSVNESLRGFIRGILQARSGAEAVERWKPYALMHNLEGVTTPLLIQVADSELIKTTPLHVAMKDAGKPVETYVFPGEYHIKWQPQHKLAVAERAIDWFRFWLKDEEDSDPAKAEQYVRWRLLRELRYRNQCTLRAFAAAADARTHTRRARARDSPHSEAATVPTTFSLLGRRTKRSVSSAAGGSITPRKS